MSAKCSLTASSGKHSTVYDSTLNINRIMTNKLFTMIRYLFHSVHFCFCFYLLMGPSLDSNSTLHVSFGDAQANKSLWNSNHFHVDCGIQYILIRDQIHFKLLSLSLGKNFGFGVLFGAFLAHFRIDLRGRRYIHNLVRESKTHVQPKGGGAIAPPAPPAATPLRPQAYP